MVSESSAMVNHEAIMRPYVLLGCAVHYVVAVVKLEQPVII